MYAHIFWQKVIGFLPEPLFEAFNFLCMFDVSFDSNIAIYNSSIKFGSIEYSVVKTASYNCSMVNPLNNIDWMALQVHDTVFSNNVNFIHGIIIQLCANSLRLVSLLLIFFFILKGWNHVNILRNTKYLYTVTCFGMGSNGQEM